MNKSYAACGQCDTCNQFVEAAGSTPEDAKLLLRHQHGYRRHIFYGMIDTRPINNEEARRIEQRKDT